MKRDIFQTTKKKILGLWRLEEVEMWKEKLFNRKYPCNSIFDRWTQHVVYYFFYETPYFVGCCFCPRIIMDLDLSRQRRSCHLWQNCNGRNVDLYRDRAFQICRRYGLLIYGFAFHCRYFSLFGCTILPYWMPQDWALIFFITFWGSIPDQCLKFDFPFWENSLIPDNHCYNWFSGQIA